MWLKIKMQKSLRLCYCRLYSRTGRKKPGLWGPPFRVVRKRAAGASWQSRHRLLRPVARGAMGYFTPLVTVLPLWSVHEKVVWLKPVLVCEVAYQEVTRDRKIANSPLSPAPYRQAVFAACTIDQLTDKGLRPAEHAGAAIETRPDDAQPDLRKYHEKRNFSVTKEPEGSPDMRGNSFVIQEHHAHKLHYDLRLERDGVRKLGRSQRRP